MTTAAILAPSGPKLSDAERQFFRQAKPWGFILFARNMIDPAQVRDLTEALRETVGSDVPILIDQEGGRVQRIGPPHVRGWLPPLEQMALAGKAGPRSMELRGRILSDELLPMGVDVNCIPVTDVATQVTHPFLLNRCLGYDAQTVAEAALALAEGLMAGGVLPVPKHWPGHGRASGDTHLDLPRVKTDLEELEATDFAAAKPLAHLPLAMTAHVAFDALDPGVPGTHSPEVIGAIRNRIGFDGLLITDDLSMEALGGSIGERAAKALNAGCDIALHCNGDLAEMEAVVASSGALRQESQPRSERALEARRSPEPFDLDAAEAELVELLGRSPYV